jgi:hypothetical protein
VSINSQGTPKFISYPKVCLYFINRGIKRYHGSGISVLETLRLNNQLTERQRWSSGNCILHFDIKCISIYDSGTPIHVAKVTSDHIQVARVHQDDSGVLILNNQKVRGMSHPGEFESGLLRTNFYNGK